MRASAMTFLYRVIVAKEDPALAYAKPCSKYGCRKSMEGVRQLGIEEGENSV